MFATERLSALHARKQELLVQSEVNRRFTAAECAAVEARVWWIEPATSFLNLAKQFWTAIAPWVTGFASAKVASHPLWCRIAAAVQTTQSLMAAWQNRARPR